MENEKEQNNSHCNEKLEQYKIILDFLKFEATTLWQIFTAFFIGHTILLGFITNMIAGKDWDEINYVLLIIASLIGMILIVPWHHTYLANSEWYYFRMMQAKNAEKEFVNIINNKDWYLLNKEAELFAEGSKVIFNKGEKEQKVFHLKFLLNNKKAGKCMILTFLGVYILIITASVFHLCCHCNCY